MQICNGNKGRNTVTLKTRMPLVEALESDPQSQVQKSKKAKGRYEREERKRENAVAGGWIPYLRDAAARYSKRLAAPLSK